MYVIFACTISKSKSSHFRYSQDARAKRLYHLGEMISQRRKILQEPAEDTDEINLIKLVAGQLSNAEKDALYKSLVREDRLKHLNFQLKRVMLNVDMTLYKPESYMSFTKLDELQDEREFRKQEMVLQLYRLWDRLKISTEDRQEFLKQNAGLRNQDLVAVCHFVFTNDGSIELSFAH